VSLPADADWDDARAAWQLAVDQRPAAVVVAADAADVADHRHLRRSARAARRAAGDRPQRGSPRDLAGTVLLRTSAMRSVTVDAERQIARIAAGAVWADVTQAAAEHGLAALAGSSADVGVVGYVLGGGLSWLGRRFGLACNDVLAVEVVTADGALRRVDATTDRSCSGRCAAAAARSRSSRRSSCDCGRSVRVVAGALFWPVEQAGEVLHAYRRWTATLPVEVSCARIMQLPAAAGPAAAAAWARRSSSSRPSPCSTRRDDRACSRRCATSAGDRHRRRDPGRDARPAAHGPARAGTGAGHGGLLAELPPEAVDALVAVAGDGSGSPLLSVELRHLGGALATAPAGAGALATLDAAFAYFAVGVAPDPATQAKVERHVDLVIAALGPWRAERAFRNFAERRSTAATFSDEATLTRLRRVKSAYDPRDVIRANHPIEPADA
jgi:hypothetical protein